ncbi:ABC-2 type transport system permease protein [Pustulibacterium marinum]|uniref:ABC-2 type transport system permease protein n=1 Tax=Pustulibacterium marinum TaxID=1224947 RepID=A0A1I7FDG7_9FLAO|nr:ABC transporter permease [Pustulibacterium marinum]SFU34145.1 ABC-2 type transport system permease protein [Pustulibacterium marinum]
MKQLKLIIKREYLNKIRNKSFIVMTFLSPLIFIGLISLVAYLSRVNNDDKQIVTVLDQTGRYANQFEDFDSFTFQYLNTSQQFESAKTAVEEQEGYGLLFIPNLPENQLKSKITFYAEDSPSIDLLRYLSKKIEDKTFEDNLKESGVNLSQISETSSNIDIRVENFSGEESSKIAGVLKLVFGGAAGYFLMMFIIIYGNMIMRSVIEEKTNRIIEIIISSVKPIQLMMGKIIGTSLAGITQFVVWLFLGSVLFFTVSIIFHVDLGSVDTPQKAMLENSGAMEAMVQTGFAEIANLPLATLIISFLIYFIGGYLLYSSIYVSIGAAVDSETDTQQFMMPVIMMLMLGVYVGFFTVINNPHGTVATVFSFIPFTSPIVMLMRIPFGVPLWQIILSMVILYITFTGVVWLAAKIYRVGILMYGKKPSYKELYKWLKY